MQWLKEMNRSARPVDADGREYQPTIGVLCPTRGRPGAALEMVKSARGFADDEENVEAWVYVDEDDPSWSTVWHELADWCRVTAGPPLVLSDYWNKLALMSNSPILGMLGDDVRFRTQGWDTKVRDAFRAVPDRIAFVHGRDGLQDEHLGTHGFLHRRWVDAVGHMTGPYFSMDYADTWINDVANELGRRVFLPDLMTEHMHPAAGKGEWDQTHRERLARGERDDAAGLYERTLSERMDDVRRLRLLMNTPWVGLG